MENFKELFAYGEYEKEGIEETLKYRIYAPENSEDLPVILFLHGAGERGFDNENQLNVGLTRIYFEKGYVEKYPAIYIAPQCPYDLRWVETDWDKCNYDSDAVGESDRLKLAKGLVDEVCEKYKADTSRIYVTGISMGGYGTWNMAMNYPDFFAAAVPICGAADVSKAEKLLRLPIRTFHSDDDWVVPPTGTREMAEAFKKLNAENFTYIEYTGLGHGCWDTAYEDENTIKWMFEQIKK